MPAPGAHLATGIEPAYEQQIPSPPLRLVPEHVHELAPGRKRRRSVSHPPVHNGCKTRLSAAQHRSSDSATTSTLVMMPVLVQRKHGRDCPEDPGSTPGHDSSS